MLKTDILQFRAKPDMHEWLITRASEEHGEDAQICVDNPYMRLLIKFDSLSNQEQANMFEYAERVMLQRGYKLNLRNHFKELLDMGNREAWGMIEEFADEFICSQIQGLHKQLTI